jgi:hypothetical protein
MINPLEINLPSILAEVTLAFERYEKALISNDVETLDRLFKDAPYTVRLGATENLYGYEAIKEFRKSRPSKGLDRTLQNTHITTFGNDMAIANTEFLRGGTMRIGRQSHTWIRQTEGWRIVSAHVSWMDE